jgi:hypothetical protein
MPSSSLNSRWSRPAPQRGGPADRVPQFEALYRANVAAVTAYFARRSAEPQTVADLTADTFVQAITLGSARPRPNPQKLLVLARDLLVLARDLLVVARDLTAAG